MSKTYRTIQNDAFDAIAYRLWGDEHLAGALIAANPGHADVLLFEAGTVLAVPDVQIRPQTSTSLPPWMEETL